MWAKPPTKIFFITKIKIAELKQQEKSVYKITHEAEWINTWKSW